VEHAIRSSQIVVLGVPSKEYRIPVEWLQDSAIVINVASYKNVDEEQLLAEKPNVMYIPQIGRVTVSGWVRAARDCSRL
jgi:methylenetetrahydrofolate dehydrogenase (NAD+)